MKDDIQSTSYNAGYNAGYEAGKRMERIRCAAIARSVWRPTWRGDPPATVVEVGQAIAEAIERGEG